MVTPNLKIYNKQNNKTHLNQTLNNLNLKRNLYSKYLKINNQINPSLKLHKN